jgi:hypothetical protein
MFSRVSVTGQEISRIHGGKKNSLSPSQQPATYHCAKPVDSSPHVRTILI